MGKFLQKPMREWAEELSAVIKIKGHDGAVRGFRKFRWMGKYGISDVKGEYVILQALYNEIIPSDRYPVFIVGDNYVGWEVLSLNGESIFLGTRFKTLEDVYEKLKKTMETIES